MVRRCSMPFRAFLHATGLLLCVWMPAHAWQPEVLHTVTILALHPAAMSTHIYKGRYTNSSDILYTWDGKHLYKGRYTNSSDIVLTVDGSVPAWLLVVVT